MVNQGELKINNLQSRFGDFVVFASNLPVAKATLKQRAVYTIKIFQSKLTNESLLSNSKENNDD